MTRERTSLRWEKPSGTAAPWWWLVECDSALVVGDVKKIADVFAWTLHGLSPEVTGAAGSEDAAKRAVIAALQAKEQIYVTDTWIDYGCCETVADVIAAQLVAAGHDRETVSARARDIASAIVTHFGAERIVALTDAEATHVGEQG